MNTAMKKQLIEAAQAACANAYAPYSGYRVGAALLGENGLIYTGANVECCSYPLCLCAERSAVSNALSQGATRFVGLAVIAQKGVIAQKDGTAPELPCVPCGACRQVLVEFCPLDMEVLCARTIEDYEVHTLTELLPYAFSPAALDSREV